MWAWTQHYLCQRWTVRRQTAEHHLTQLKASIVQVRADLADLHEEVAFTLEDLDGLVRRISRVQEQIQERYTSEPELVPRMFDESGYQR